MRRADSCRGAGWYRKELEPSRPVTSGVNSIRQANRSGFAGALDVVGYNGGGDSVFQYDEDKKDYPRRKMYGSEVPHTFATRGICRTTTRFRDQGKPGFENMMTTHVPDLTDEEVFDHVPDHYYSSYDNSLVRISSQQSWRLIRERDFMAGEFRWTGFDYLGESLGWPAKYFQGGVMDLCGFKKDLHYLYQAMWTDAPMAHILPHWTHPGKEGVEIPVCVFNNCDAVELFFSGMCYAVIQSGLSSGAVAVTCSSPGLVSAGIELAMYDTPAVFGQA